MDVKFLHLIDAYKIGHRAQYPKGTNIVFSNMTPRKSRIPGVDSVVFFGLQYFIKEYIIDAWASTGLRMPEKRYTRRVNNMIGPGTTFDHINALLSKETTLPIEIWALPEGSHVPIGVPPMVMWNTKPEFFWLTNYLETILSCSLWQACTSATIADRYRKLFESWADKTGGDKGFVQFQGHDFSFRGMSSLESAVLSGMGHLLSFSGTDTVPAIDALEEYYGANSDTELVGVSVPATEHSVMSMGGKESELDTYNRILDLYPTGIVSIVSDTWDFFGVLTNILPKLKDRIMARNGKVVIRPDSSKKTPLEIICGDPTSNDENERKGAIELLWDLFGGTINEKGYKVLDPHIGLIYGDSITYELADKICQALADKDFASTNWVAGIGSYTYQYNTRDTFGFAMKATYGEVNGVGREIFKDPKTDSGMKKSAKGLIAVYKNEEGQYYMKDQATWQEVVSCEYVRVYPPQEDHSLKQIRERIRL